MNAAAKKIAAKAGRYKGVMCVIARIHRVEKMLSSKPVSATTISESEEVCIKTIHRLIEFMRSSLGMDISSSPRGYTRGGSR